MISEVNVILKNWADSYFSDFQLWYFIIIVF